MLVTLAFGAWNGFLVAVLGIQPIIATLVLMLAGRGIALLITGGFITTVTSAPYRFMAQGYFVGLPFAFYVSVAAIALVVLIERRTALGVLTEAVGINPEASRLAGVRSRGIVWGAYAASGLLAGIAGILYSSNIMAADANAAGQYIELDAILAVVLGGTSLMGGKFSIAGTVIGVFTIQTLKSTITFLGVPPAVSPVFLAIVVIIVVLVQSQRVRTWAEAASAAAPRRRRRRWRREHDVDSAHAAGRAPRSAATTAARVVDPGARRARDPDRSARRRPGVLRQLPHAARAVVAAARQRVPADPRGRNDVRDPHRRASTSRWARCWRSPRSSAPGCSARASRRSS